MTKPITTVACKEANDITPAAIHPVIKDSLTTINTADYADQPNKQGATPSNSSPKAELGVYIDNLESNMRESA